MAIQRFCQKKNHKAFSLIELLVVIAIIALIASLAFPSYQQHVINARRADAQIALTSAASEQERHFTYANSYTSDLTELGGNTSPEGFYTLSVTATAISYSLVATATGSQASDISCYKFTLDHLGIKGSTDDNDVTTTGCWK